MENKSLPLESSEMTLLEKKMLQKKLHEWIDEETGGEDDETTI